MTFIHKSSCVDNNVKLGSNVFVWHFSHILSGTVIGDNCVLGQNVMVGPEVKVGNGCKIQNNVSIYEGVELGNNVFCGPSCVFTNVINPRAFINRKKQFKKTIIEDCVTIGANATIVCGVNIGKFAFIGAGAVVTKDIGAHELVVGTPAKKVGWVSEKGNKLGDDLICPESGEEYYIKKNKLTKRNY